MQENGVSSWHRLVPIPATKLAYVGPMCNIVEKSSTITMNTSAALLWCAGKTGSTVERLDLLDSFLMMKDTKNLRENYAPKVTTMKLSLVKKTPLDIIG